MQPIQIYLAGTCTFGIAPGQPQYLKLIESEIPIADAVKHRLDSYHYVGKQRKVNEIRASGVKIFLDSGAFSAATLGVTISVEEYCQYIHENMDIIRFEDGIMLASVLDDINDEAITYANQLKMESLGVKPLPTFHAGEDERYLEWYIANYPYMSLGGMVGQTTQQLEIWLDRVWGRYLLDGAGNPKIRVHGFGITSERLMERYPWYSCDSSSWIQTTSFGAITIPGYGNLDLSYESPSRHVAGQHLDTLTPIEYDQVKNLLSSQGFDLELIQSRYLGRAIYNMWAYSELERIISDKKMAGFKLPLRQELF